LLIELQNQKLGIIIFIVEDVVTNLTQQRYIIHSTKINNMWSNVYINIFLEKTYIYIFDSSIAKGRRQKLYIERPASVKEIPSMLTELADLFMFLWWNLTLSHQCSCYYFSRLILVFNNFTMLFLPY